MIKNWKKDLVIITIEFSRIIAEQNPDATDILLAGDVKRNPGPSNQHVCQECAKSVHNSISAHHVRTVYMQDV